jgi:hypothetical protein
VNSLWRITGRPSIILVGVIGLLLIDIRQAFQVGAQTGSIPLRGGVQQPPQALDQEAGPQLFRGPAGELFRVSMRRIEEIGTTVLLGASPDGVTWRTLIQLPERKGGSLREGWLAANDNGDLALVYRWVNDHPKIKNLRLARSTDAGKTWTVSNENIDSTGGSFAPQVAWGPERTLVMAWLDEGAPGRQRYDVHLRRSPDGGATWDEPVVVTRSRKDGLSYKPRLYGDGKGRFWLAWVESGSTRRSVLLLSRSQDNGRTWSPPQQVSGTTHSIVGQSLEPSGPDRLLLTWQAQRFEPTEVPPRIYAATSRDAGATWSPPVPVDGLLPQASTMALFQSSAVTPSGEAWVVWQDNRHGRNDVFAARSPDGGLTWGPPVRLDADSPGTAESLHPRLAVSQDGATVGVVWQDDRRGLEAVYFRMFSGGQWSAETVVGTAIPLKKAARNPQIAPAGKDGFYVVWELADYSQGRNNPQVVIDDAVVRIR